MTTSKPKSKVIFDPTKMSVDIPVEERRTSPAPIILGPVYKHKDKVLCIDLSDATGRLWTLCSHRMDKLRSALRYFRAMDRKVITQLGREFKDPPRQVPTMIQWQRKKNFQCVTCLGEPRIKPNKDEPVYGCLTCGTEGIEIRETPPPVPKPPQGSVEPPASVVPVVTEEPKKAPKKRQPKVQEATPDPAKGMSLLDRIRAKKVRGGN